ncbi:unnamed protein product [Adineta steineri]|uniref:G-protein coupled receptors family 1 profile domain-containing protein n=1 Tax=Adineta steineri TaxID=433720 RepID=A0A818GW19_9BILA|nr:unnamed protein product [Adineta steineri]CAF3495059.1 unnamed protein product [Adineta steineri]
MDALPNYQYVIHRIKFFVILSLQIPAILIFLFIFAFFITNPTQLNKLQNKALLVLFIVNFVQLTVNLPMCLDFFRLSYISPATGIYCRGWMYIESTLDATNELLAAIISIQRHPLIFRPHLFRNTIKRYVFYYLPLLFGVIYPVAFYMGTIVFYPCDNADWDFTSNMCGDTTCYLTKNPALAMFDWIVNTALLAIVIMLANIVLIIRVIRQRLRQQRAVSWSKQRRMTIQLISISSLYLLIWIPSIIFGLIQQISPTDEIDEIQTDYVEDLTYFICLLIPWIGIGMLPDFKKWMLKQFHRLRKPPNAIGTTTVRTEAH